MHKIEIGHRLLELRKYIGMSRNSLAQLSNIPATTIKSWEYGLSEIRSHNLEKYLAELAQLGCRATVAWVMNGDGNAPYVSKGDDIHTTPSVSINHVIALLSKTSNLFYYLDTDENIAHINHKLLFLLGGDVDHTTYLPEKTKLQELCDKEIYSICHKNFVLCLDKQEQTFSYMVQPPYSKTFHTVDALYWPLVHDKNHQVLGVLCFVSNTQNREIE